MSIQTVAFMSMCHCGQHGHFVLADGTVGTEFFSGDEAREELAKLHGEKSISDIELMFLRSQVSDAPRLSSSNGTVSALARLVCEVFEEISADYLKQEPTNGRVM